MREFDVMIRTQVERQLGKCPAERLDALARRVRREQHERTAAASSITFRRLARPVAISALLLVVFAGAALAVQPAWRDAVQRRWFAHDAANSTTNKSKTPTHLAVFEVAALRQMFDGAPVDVSSDHGPVAAEMKPLGEGRILFDGAAGRLAALDSKRGDVCYVLSRNGAPAMSTCVGDLPATGVAFSVFLDGPRFLIPALVADDVTGVDFVLADGTLRSVPIGANGFVWEVAGDLPGEYPVDMVVTRGGKRLHAPVSIQ